MDQTPALERLSWAAHRPADYAAQWRERHPGRPVVGVLPMNFPREIACGAGALPVVVQDDQRPVNEGRALLAEFYCGYTRNLTDQAATGRLAGYDALFLADHCISLIGAADVVRSVCPDMPVYFGMLISSMSDAWAPRQIQDMIAGFRDEFAAVVGSPIEDDALRTAIVMSNRDRRLVRRILDERSQGASRFTSTQLQDVVTSSMVMDPVEHHDLLVDALAATGPAARDDRVRVHLSGHLCHAPRADLLEAIEDSGAVVVDDDLYHGRRYVSTDVHETGDPLAAIAQWYRERNVNIPCPTRVQHEVDWDRYLLGAVRASGAEAVIHLMPKFCEPHMLFYPELRRSLDAEGIPQLLLETEHEGTPTEAVRTRVEAIVERVHRRRAVHA
jgi:benzoyl-CoA reductase subunit C